MTTIDFGYNNIKEYHYVTLTKNDDNNDVSWVITFNPCLVSIGDWLRLKYCYEKKVIKSGVNSIKIKDGHSYIKIHKNGIMTILEHISSKRDVDSAINTKFTIENSKFIDILNKIIRHVTLKRINY